jgi:hypothetical protein
MKLKSNDPLQQLLREAMHQHRGQVSGNTTKVLTASAVPELKQCERKNEWTTSGTVALIHRDLKGRETYLGAYELQISSLFKARRFVPAHSTPHGKLPKEVVTGDYWLHQQVAPPTVDTVQEVKAIEARFKELMDLYKDVE